MLLGKEVLKSIETFFLQRTAYIVRKESISNDVYKLRQFVQHPIAEVEKVDVKTNSRIRCLILHT